MVSPRFYLKLRQSQLTKYQLLKPVVLNYEGKYCKAGDAWQSSVAVLGAATRARSTDVSIKQLIMSYIIGDGMGLVAAAKLKMLCPLLGLRWNFGNADTIFKCKKLYEVIGF